MEHALQGRWFDGRTSAARPVRVRLQASARGPAFALQAEDGESLVLRNDQVRWPERWSARRVPRKVLVDLGARGSVEIDDAQGWVQALSAAGQKETVATRMQTRWTAFLVVLVAVAALLGAFYRWGTPWLAAQLAREVPLAWERAMADRTLKALDAGMLKPSRLPPERQAALRARFDALLAQVPPDLRRYRGYAPRIVLHFRSGMPPNALALPGGTIIVTDEIVALADREHLGDHALAGVLAHEAGHVLHRHTTRRLMEQGVLNAGLGLALGDVSWLLSVGASTLADLSYSRGNESEADCFASTLMQRTGQPTAPMADLLLRMEAEMRGKRPEAAAKGSGWSDLLSTHPATHERAEALKRGTLACR